MTSLAVPPYQFRPTRIPPRADLPTTQGIVNEAFRQLWYDTHLHQLSHMEVFNVRRFGARGDGVTDDTTDVNAAAAAAEGGVLYFPNGTYKVTDHISIPSDCTVVMAAGAVVKQYTEAKSGFQVASQSNVRLHRCTVDYATTAVRQTTGAIHVVSSTNVEVVHCRVIKAAGLGIYVANSLRGRIHGNIVESTLADGIHVTNGSSTNHVSKDITITGNTCNANEDDAIAVIGYTTSGQLVNENITIAANVVRASEARGITVGGAKYVSVTGNSIADIAGGAGINVYLDETFDTFASEDVSVIGNVIAPASGASTSNRHGIQVYRSHRVVVAANVVDWRAGSGIKVFGKSDNTDDALDCQVVNNIVKGTTTGEQGIHGLRANRLLIRGNTVINATKAGIYADTCDGVVIDGNVLDEANQQDVGATNLMTVASGSGAVVTNNFITQTTTDFTHAITIISQGNVSHAGNRFTLTATMAGAPLNNSSSNLNPAVSADRGDANVTLTVDTDAETQRFATELTENRTVTLSTTGARHGSKFRVVRTGLGSFTLDVGGLKTIPSATAAFVDVEYRAAGAAWMLTGYGTL